MTYNLCLYVCPCLPVTHTVWESLGTQRKHFKALPEFFQVIFSSCKPILMEFNKVQPQNAWRSIVLDCHATQTVWGPWEHKQNILKHCLNFSSHIFKLQANTCWNSSKCSHKTPGDRLSTFVMEHRLSGGPVNTNRTF